MHIERIGFTPIKGGRHVEHPSVGLALDGPLGDRLFCLVDLQRGRVLRTVDNPALLATTARWQHGQLRVEIDGRVVTAEPRSTGKKLTLEYWGRPAEVEVVDGPWADAYSAYLGRDVAFTRAVRSGELVYGASVTLITTGALRLLEEKLGHGVDSSRFRANLVIDSDDLEPHVEDSWTGGELHIGSARLRVMDAVDRCAVIDFDPATGASGSHLLTTLAGYRLRSGTIDFGMYAEVTSPGLVERGQTVMFSP
ncbi:MOSC domain-containing protein [Glaciihabitans sp. UYNi722]|uniref:MOSC domain-containing protein n=1 Tax=Glaciihabitans sp. UYNi722 TaxID=3156344 RepID=UPI0033949B84